MLYVNASYFSSKITTHTVDLDANLIGKETNFWNWGYKSGISVRLYPSFDDEENIYIGFSDGNMTGKVVVIDGKTYQKKRTDSFKYRIRGLAVEPNGEYGVLAWDVSQKNINFISVSAKGSISGTYNLPLGDNTVPLEGNGFGIGDSRLSFANGTYHAYFHVHSSSGHEGDALYTIKNGVVTRIWSWGCSHSMSNLLSYNEKTDTMIHVCDSDAYPGHGMFAENSRTYTLYTHPANERGSSAGDLGGITTYEDGWLMIMNSYQPETGGNTYTGKQDIGLIWIGKDKKRTNVKFLTSTDDVDELNGCIATYSVDKSFLVGYSSGSRYYLGIADREGMMLKDFEDVTSMTKWGDRDDSFRRMKSGKIFWVHAPVDNGKQLVITTLVPSYATMTSVVIALLAILAFI